MELEGHQPHYTQIGTSTILWHDSSTSRNINVENLCRICGNTSECLIPVFSAEGSQHQLHAKINHYLPIKINLEDRLPSNVCYACASSVLSWDELVENCLQAQKKIMNLMPNHFKVNDCDNIKRDVLYYSAADSGKLIELLPPDQPVQKEIIPEIAQTSDEMSSLDCLNEIQEPFNEKVYDGKTKKKRKRKKSLSTCLICGKVFNFIEYLKSHLLTHSEARPHLCVICGTSFKRKDHVNHHRKTVHVTHPDVIRELNVKGEEPLTCEECGDIKPTRHAMELHKKKHAEKSVCDICEESFSLPSLLRSHMIKSHTDQTCACHICGEVLKSGHSLYIHKKRHFTSYICEICGKNFSLPSSLKAHMVVHSDDKPFTCEECGKSFKLKVRLQLHKQTHKDVRPHACNICSKSFKTKSALVVHTNMHTDRRQYPCPHCPFRARKNSDLVCHIRTHTGEKPFKCDKCGRGFAQASDMRKHKLTHERLK